MNFLGHGNQPLEVWGTPRIRDRNDDILFYVKRIGPFIRMLIVGVIGFVAAEFLYGSRGPDSGALQFWLYGLVGFIPGVMSSWLAHKLVAQHPLPAAS